METENHINSFVEFSIIQWNTRNKLKWYFGYNLFALESKPTHMKSCLEKSHIQMLLLKKMESFKNTNKRWNKVNDEEKSMLKRMSVNNYSEKIQFNQVRNVIKKEIWKLAMQEVKQLKSKNQAKCAGQILFYYRFRSTNKRKRITYISQISDQTIIILHDLENLLRKKND
jgi:hypothetical protein